MILLDNFETPWNPLEGGQKDVEHILRSLSSLPRLAILVTMRSNFPPSDKWERWNLLPTDNDASRTIYTDIDPTAADHPALPHLLDALGHMPYAVTLMATLGTKSMCAPDELLELWQKGGTKMLSNREVGMDHCIGLSVNSTLVTDNPEALILLATLSMLPAGTNHRHLNWWAPSLGNRARAIATLRDAALVVDRESGDPRSVVTSVLPVVQSYMQQSGRISETVRHGVRAACYKYVCKHKSSPGDTTFTHDAAALASEETNLQAILLEATRSKQGVQMGEGGSSVESTSLPETHVDPDTQLDALLVFSWYQHYSKPRSDVAERTVTVARMMKKERHLAEALFCLGGIAFKTDRYRDACNCFGEARECFKTLSDGPDLHRAGECALRLSYISTYMNDVTAARKFVFEAQADLKESGSAYSVACGLLGLGRFYSGTDDFDKALETLGAAQTAFECLHRPVDVAHCLYTTARCEAHKGRYSEALDASQRALQVFERFGLNYQTYQAVGRTAEYLKILGRYDDAIQILPRCLEECQRIGNPIETGQTLEKFAEIYVHMKDYRAARAAYQGALEQYESMLGDYMGDDGAGRCRHNLLQVTQREEDPTNTSICLPYSHGGRPML